MKAMRASMATLLLAACASTTPIAEKEPDPGLAEFIMQNTRALGGAAALDGVQTMVKQSLIEEGDYRDVAVFATDRNGRMRVDLFADGERVFAESYNGQSGFQWRPDEGQSPASQRGTIALSHTPQLPNHIFRLKDMAQNGHRLELLQPEQREGRAFQVLRLTLSDGFETYLLLEESSGLVTRSRNRRALHVDINDQQKVIESRVSDFRRVGDIVHPHRVEEVDLKTGETLVRVTVHSVRLNVPLSAEYFDNLVSEVPQPHPVDQPPPDPD
ncbi:MAG: hypothetical protein QNJ40_10655 [Xanthomonadales bacterium]|nr:hypothetical protein [Xanthomonadales bacterium]